MIGSDDVLLPDKIEKQVSIFEQLEDDFAIVFGKPYRMDIKGTYFQKDYYTSIGLNTNYIQDAKFEDLLLQNFISSTSHLVRISAIKEVGMYDEELRVEDWDLWLRLLKRYRFYFTNEYDSIYRIVPNSLTNNLKNFASVYSTYCRLLIKHLGYSKKGDENIARNLKSFSIKVYKYDGEDRNKFLKQSWKMNKDFKTFILLLTSSLRIKYKVYESIKFWN